MKINYGVLFAGAAIGGVIGWYYMKKVQIPNAYAIGQANPTLPYQNLTAAQKAQFNQSPGLPSPPPMATVVANAISGVGSGDQSQSIGQRAGTGALLNRRRPFLPIRYQGVRRG